MKKIILSIGLSMFVLVVTAQNLVPNGDLAQFVNCPLNFNEITKATYWTNPTEGGTPDYFNACANGVGSHTGVPSNFFGYQSSVSGDAYAGFYNYQSHTFGREYIQVSLSDSLKTNQCYLLKMYINLAEESTISISNIGAYFTDTALYQPGILNSRFYLTPHISNSIGNYPDTANWTLVSGYYTAHGGERYMTLGNFDDSAIIDVDTSFSSNGKLTNSSYFYIDNVSLTPCISQNVNDLTNNKTINVYPNPFDNYLQIESENASPITVTLYDISSKVIMTKIFNGNGKLNTTGLTRGFYFYQITTNDGKVKNGKLFKE